MVGLVILVVLEGDFGDFWVVLEGDFGDLGGVGRWFR